MYCKCNKIKCALCVYVLTLDTKINQFIKKLVYELKLKNNKHINLNNKGGE